MASNKKAQILAAVMCASSIFGSYTVVSAETPATTISNNSANNINKDTAKVVASENNNSGTITATVKDSNGTETSKITLNGEKGTFTLNSKNLKIDSNNGLRIYDPKDATNKTFWGISSTGAISGTGLTVKGTSTIDSINSKNPAQSASSIVSYSQGVKDTVANGTNTTTSTVAYNGVTDTVTNDISKVKGYTTTAQVLYSGVNNKVVDNNTNNTLAQTSVGLVDRPQDNSKYGNIVLTANKYVVDTEATVTKKVSTTILTLDGNTAKLEAGVGGNNNAYVNLNSDKKGIVAIKAGTVDGVQGNVTLSGKNVNLDGNGLTLYKDNAEGTKTQYAALNSSGLSINNNANFDRFGTNSYNTTFKATNSEQSYNLEKWNGGELENKVSSKLDTSGLTTTVQSKGAEAGIENTNSTKNKTTSAVAYNSVTDTVYDANGKKTSYSNVGTTSIADTIYASNGTTTLASSNISKSVSGTTESGSVALTANKITTNGDETTTLTSKLNLTGDSATLTSGSASVKVDNATGNVAITANQKGSQGYVTLSGKNVNLNGNGLTLYKDNAEGTKTQYAALNSSGLSINNNANFDRFGTNSYNTTFKATNSEQSYNLEKWNGGELENKVSSKLDTSGLTTTVQSKGAEAGIENTNSTKNKTTSAVAYNSVTDTVYDANGKKTSYSNVGTTSIADTIYASNGTTTLASSNISKSVSGTTESGSVALTANKITTNGDETTTLTSKLNLTGDSATLASGSASVTLNNTTGNVAITANQKGAQGYVTLSGKNVKLDSNGLNIYDGINTKATATITKAGAITGTGLTVNGTGTSSIKAENATTGAYVKNEISSGGMTTTARGGMYPSDADNKNKTTSQVSATGVRDSVYDDGGQIKATSSVTTSGIANTVNNSSITNTVNDVNTGKPLTDSRLTTSGISNTTTALQMTGTNAGNTMSTGIYQNNGGISASATKKDVDGNTIGTSTLSLGGNSASLKVGNYGFAVDSNNNVSINGKNARLDTNGLSLNKVNSDGTTTNYGTWNSSGLTLKDTNGKTATLTTSGLTLKDGDGNTTGGVSSTGAITGTSLSIKAPIDPIKPNNDYVESKVTTSGVADTIKQGGFTRATSNVTINSIKDTIYTNDGKELSSSNISKSVSDATESGSVTLIANKITTNDDATTTTLTSKLNLTGDSATLTSGSAYVKADNTTGNVLFSGKNVSLSGSTFTLKDVTNGKILASLGASGLSINNADGIKVGGISNTGYLMANDGMNVTDKNSSWVTIGTSTMQKDITATTTTSYAGITNKIDTTLAGNKTYTSGTVVGPTGVTTTVQGSNTTDAISGNKNKTTSTVSATGVTDTVYNVKGNQVASSSVTTNGIVNTTTNLSIDGSTNNTMSTSIYQDKRGISASATKKDENGTVGTSTLTLGGNSASLKVGNYGFAVDSNNNVSINGKNARLDTNGLSLNKVNSDGTTTNYGTWNSSGLTLKDTNGKTATLTTSGLTLKDEDGNITGGVSATGVVSGTRLDIDGTSTSSIKSTNATTGAMGQSQVSYYGVTDTVTNAAGNKTTSTVSATGVTDRVYDTDGKTQVAYSSVGTGGISNTTTALQMTGTNAGNTMSTGIYQNNGGISASATKKDVDGNTIGTSTLSLGGNSASLKVGNYGFAVDSNNNVSINGKNARLDTNGLSLNKVNSDGTTTNYGTWNSSGLTLKDTNGKTATLTTSGLTLKDEDGNITGGVSATGVVSGTRLDIDGTSTSSIKSTNATTGAMGQSQVSYYGVTDTVTNAAGNKTTSTVSATGTIDQVYDVDGKTRIAYSNVTTSGITDSFTKDGITNSVTTNANGTTFASTGNGTTTIKGGSITTNSITVAGNTIDGGFFDTIGETNSHTAGIVRTEINGDWITSIEGAINISRSGNISLNADKLTYSYNDGKNSGTLGALANKVDDIYDRTQGIDYDKATGTTTIDGNLSVKDETTTGSTGSTGETGTATNNGNITANTANIGGVQIGKNAVTATTGNFDNVAVGGTEGTSISKDGVTVGDKKSDNYTSITNNDVVVNNNGNKTSLADVGNRVTGLESSVNSMNNRLSDVEDRIDKVGAMSAAIANLRTMGFDPEAPTEIAIGVGQYKSETGLALGIFHYPNQDFMLSASISTSGDEVMGGIGATWKLGRKSAAEKAKDEEARRLEKAEEMKKLAQDAKVKAQAERHAKLLAEREAQKTA